MTIVFATNNPHKLEEIRSILGPAVAVLSLEDIGCREDIAETGETLEENALIKALYVREHYGYDCFADDTGLEVRALGGEPGIFSARYAGEGHDSGANMDKLLAKLQDTTDRRARFRTVIALVRGQERRFFEGTVEGTITRERRGTGGFGYDPVFVPEGYAGTFAELGSEVKNTISHRAKAVQKLARYLLDD